MSSPLIGKRVRAGSYTGIVVAIAFETHFYLLLLLDDGSLRRVYADSGVTVESLEGAPYR